MSVILVLVKMSMNGIGFLSTYLSIGDYKIYPLGWLIGAGLMLVSLFVPEDIKKNIKNKKRIVKIDLKKN